MAFRTDCPSCHGQLNVPNALIGKDVRCPTCGTIFTAPASAESPPPAAEPAPAELGRGIEDSAPATPPAPVAESSASPEAAPLPVAVPAPAEPMTGEEFRHCPYCSESIRKDATYCPYCGEVLGQEEEGEFRPWERTYRPRGRRDSEPHRGGMILTFGILSIVLTFALAIIGLPFGIAAWVMGHKDLKKIRSHMMDPEGEGITQAGWVCGIVGTILGGLYTLACVGYLGFVTFAFTAMARTARPMGATPAPPAVQQATPPTYTQPIRPQGKSVGPRAPSRPVVPSPPERIPPPREEPLNEDGSP